MIVIIVRERAFMLGPYVVIFFFIFIYFPFHYLVTLVLASMLFKFVFYLKGKALTTLREDLQFYYVIKGKIIPIIWWQGLVN